MSHGFVRASNGTFTTFDVPGGTITFGSSINPAGTVTGSYIYLNDPNFILNDPNFIGHGFLRTKGGTFSTFDAPGAVLFIANSSINPAETVTGSYYDVNFVAHGFLRTSAGNITAFDAPGADTNPNDFHNGTHAVGIDPSGIIIGAFTDTNANAHGFLRAIDGSFATFDPPGQIAVFASFSFGSDLYMSPSGVVTGTYFQSISGNPSGGNYRVFVQATDGTFTTFDAVPYPNGNPSLNIPCCTWSFPAGITPSGVITGSFNDGFTINHGFLRASDGTITTFDVPGAGKGFDQGTAPLGITPGGVIMGVYFDPNGVQHGFLFFPQSCC